MECRGVNLLLLIVLTGIMHAVTKKEKTLNMAPNAVDDTFSGCRDKMLQMVNETLLQEELKASKDFQKIWNNKKKLCNTQIKGVTELHWNALMGYGNSKAALRKTFNDMVQTTGSNATVYKEQFLFKSLHFLLTDVMHLLKINKTCNRVYYGTENVYTVENGTEIRFGRFLSAAIKKSSQTENIEDDGTLFDIISCSLVNTEEHCTSEEIEHLISPTEVFKVENIKDDDFSYKEITLKHLRFQSNHNCYLFERSAPNGSSSSLLSSILLTLMALSLYYCSAQ